jgi:hypothetical protein
VVEWNSRHPQINRFNHGYTSKAFCVRHHRPDSKIRRRVPQTGRQLISRTQSIAANIVAQALINGANQKLSSRGSALTSELKKNSRYP